MSTAALDIDVEDRLFRRIAPRRSSPVTRLDGDFRRFVAEYIAWEPGEGPTDYQDEILGKLTEGRRVAVRGPHSLGKTAVASWIVLGFALMNDGMDWKAPCTASVWRQLSKYLWPEIHKWARRLRWDKLGRDPFDLRTELLQLNLKLATGEAFAVASDLPAMIEGAHADRLLYVFDEAKTIPDATFDAAEGAFASGDCYAIAISTPGEPIGRFYDIHKRKPGYEDWWTRHVKRDECIAAGRMSREWAEQRKAQWGEGSAVYQNRVLGEFASSEEEGVIPLAWVEAANQRWLTLQDSGEWGEFKRAGIDVARSGIDLTSYALRYGNAIKELRRYAKEDTMATAGRAAAILKGLGGEAYVDVIGIGAGVVDRLREQKFAVVAFNASESTDLKDRAGILGFTNQRSAGWWTLREMLDPANGEDVALPPDDLLTGDLTAPHWRVMSGGRIQIESKDDIRKRIGRSTDDGDAVVMAFAQLAEEIRPNMRPLY
ncbi:MAG TPA: hypothetical protein VM537_05755 [Anaerolineae bacterium]|nr:hypothetical protein [Anaerolineae bacterium]